MLQPVSTIAEFRLLDEAEVLSGYMDGIRGLPCVVSQHTRSYWHGWRNGAVDAGLVEPDEAQWALEAEFLTLRED
ncbi:hypothetical protein M0638_13290 [Roseomonas sp. NAR14]|uniref:Uncharacterized protein n=1 Tax=Roseomonas acroporae TaxID=2937791 RepID=A0A9X1Y887_9PROT|nr:hypothetical protein [Roseomonas acroporae]MCK8785358.1 hypothetical protein [Roseomonas acroporae]